MARFRYFPGPRAGLLAGLALLVIATDIAFRVWVPPAEVPVAGDQTEKALSRLQPADPRLAPPFDPFYEEVATRSGAGPAESAVGEEKTEVAEPVFEYRLLAVSEFEDGRSRAVIKVTYKAAEADATKTQIESVTVGDDIGDARITAISKRGVVLSSRSLGVHKLALFLPSRAAAENGTASAGR